MLAQSARRSFARYLIAVAILQALATGWAFYDFGRTGDFGPVYLTAWLVLLWIVGFVLLAIYQVAVGVAAMADRRERT